uniref:F-box domain-containing protein n=1 Tax=Globodera pallida TaxID=36090 RepID=A0A183BT11_GLOPA
MNLFGSTNIQNRRRCIWLPSELWTDSFKMLGRQELLRRVQPVSRRFHAICEQNVSNLHVIRRVNDFLDGFERAFTEVEGQFEELNNDCGENDLAKFFRLVGQVQFRIGKRADTMTTCHERRRRAQLALLRHCAELFCQCQLSLWLHKPGNSIGIVDESTVLSDLDEYLALLKPIKAFSVEIWQQNHSPDLAPNEWYYERNWLLSNTTVLNCSRLTFHEEGQNEPELMTKWLHYKVADEQNAQNATRFLNFPNGIQQDVLDTVLQNCVKRFDQANSIAERLSYVLSFHSIQPQQSFRSENLCTAETLLMEAFGMENEAGGNRTTPNFYYLRRCATKELAGNLPDAQKFYRENFYTNNDGDKMFLRIPILQNETIKINRMMKTKMH